MAVSASANKIKVRCSFCNILFDVEYAKFITGEPLFCWKMCEALAMRVGLSFAKKDSYTIAKELKQGIRWIRDGD